MRRSGDFSRAVRGGVRTGKSTLVVHLAASSSETDAPSVGFVVSKAVGNAVVRNRVKRRLRAIVADRMPDLPAGVLIVVRALPEAAAADYARLDADLRSCLRRALARRPQVSP